MNKSFNDLFNTNPRYSTSISFILGLILIDNLNTSEQNMLGNWIILLGQTILTNASAQNVIESRIQNRIININSKETKSIYDPLIYNIDKIRDIINKVYPNNSQDINTLSKILNELQEKIDSIKKD